MAPQINLHEQTPASNPIREAFEWMDSQEGEQEIRRYPGECLLISGRRIVGHGQAWREAYQMAIDIRVDLNGTVRHYNEAEMPDLSPS